MIGDPIILSDKDFVRAENVLKENPKKRVLLIGGGSGTNKSELAYCLQKLLFDQNKSSFIVSLDDYYLVHATIRSTNREKLGLESVGLSEIDWESVKRIYEDFEGQREIHFKRTHRFLESIEHNTIASSEIDYIIFEGLYANYLKKFYSDNFSVFLEGSPKQTLKFRKMRGKEDETDKFRAKVVQKEYNVVVQLKRYADLTIEFKEKK